MPTTIIDVAAIFCYRALLLEEGTTNVTNIKIILKLKIIL
jgi:hypothetical protein